MRSVTVALISLAMLSGCARPLPPQDVADRFWRAVITQHPAKIRRYVREENQATLKDDPEILPVSEFELGRVVIDGESATIETRITLDADKPVALKIDTELVREGERWRVDYTATIDDISTQSQLAQVIGQIENIGGAIADGIDKSVDEMKKMLPEIERQLSRIEAEIKQRMPELRERLEEFSKSIEESLKLPPEEQGPPAPPETIEI